MGNRLKRMLIKEFIQLRRDPRMLFMILVAPVVQLAVLAFAITTDVRNIDTYIHDCDNTPASREVVSRIAGSGYFNIAGYISDPAAITELLDTGAAQCVLVFNPGFGGSIAGGDSTELQVLVDGTDSNTSSAILRYINTITAGYNADIIHERLARQGRLVPGGINLVPRAWFNPNLLSQHSYLPGLMCNVLILITVVMTAMAIVREQEIGTIEQIMVTPLKPLELILGKTLPFAILGLVTISLMLLIAHLMFGLPAHGSLLLFYGGIVLFLFATLGAGLLISTISATQQQALLTSFLYMLPVVLLSGFMFPIHNMPQAIQWVTYLNPMRYFITITQGVLLKGSGIDALWPQFALLGALGVTTILFAASRFSKTEA